MDISTVDYILTTTRSVRKRLDLRRPVEREVITRCLEIAVQAPTGGNTQGWHFLVVTDADKRAQIGDYYRESFRLYRQEQMTAPRLGRPVDVAQVRRVLSSADYLAHNLGRVPVLILPCIEGRVEQAGPMRQASLYGSILPAAWSLMLALRARGLGTAWTTLHLRYEREVAALLGIPTTITQAALLPVAYYTGDDFKPATRVPARQVTYWETWSVRDAAA